VIEPLIPRRFLLYLNSPVGRTRAAFSPSCASPLSLSEGKSLIFFPLPLRFPYALGHCVVVPVGYIVSSCFFSLRPRSFPSSPSAAQPFSFLRRGLFPPSCAALEASLSAVVLALFPPFPLQFVRRRLRRLCSRCLSHWIAQLLLLLCFSLFSVFSPLHFFFIFFCPLFFFSVFFFSRPQEYPWSTI